MFGGLGRRIVVLALPYLPFGSVVQNRKRHTMESAFLLSVMNALTSIMKNGREAAADSGVYLYCHSAHEDRKSDSNSAGENICLAKWVSGVYF